MRVLHLHDRLSARGGAERHLLSLLARLQGRDDTLLAVGFDDASLPPAERVEIGPWQRVKGLDRSGLSARGGQAARARLGEAIDAFAPELIHVHNLMDPGLMALAAEAGPTVMTVQDHRLFCPGRGKLLPDGRLCDRAMGPECLACFDDPDYGRRMLELTRARLEALQAMGRVLVLSNYMASELALVGVDPARISVLPPPVELPPRVGTGERGYHLLAGRLVGRKGVRVALEARELLSEPLPLVVAGDGPLAGEVARAASASGGRLIFEGWADRARMGALLAGAASLWVPSLWAEPWGLVGPEALSRATPVAAAPVGGVPEWLRPGEHGLAAAPGDARALAEAADRLAADSALARGLGRAGRDWVRQHLDEDKLMARLKQTYQRAQEARP
ncbi:MAG: glycosyltransferase family 4 protein [Desulfarculaceae bacterium]|nr:glycosyltransferase family 4 protein [Desulfarculaceae bacterium]